MAYYRIGNMLHIYIQKGEEAMKIEKNQKNIRGNAAFMKRIMMDTKGCGQLTSNDTYFADICFSGVEMV